MAMISDEVERISGYPASDFIQSRVRTFASIIHPDDQDDVEREVSAAVTEHRPYGLEYRIVRADGAIAWVLERGQRVGSHDDGAPLHGVIFDITERKRAEDTLRRHEAEQARIAELKAHAQGSSRQRTRPVDRSSATSTTAPSSSSWRCRARCGWRRRGFVPIPMPRSRCSTRRSAHSTRRPTSYATSPAASTRPS
jgi:PAS domain S-box-containing protein